MKTLVITNPYPEIDVKKIAKDFDYIIGVDKASFQAINDGIKLDLAIGDFDSLEASKLELVKKNTLKTIVLNCIKDNTDTYEALENAKGSITILGGILGKRVEHLVANIMLFEHYKDLVIMDQYSMMYLVEPGEYDFKPDEYKFISFFAYDNEVEVTLKGFKYPLINYRMKRFDPLGISNEVLEEGKLILKGDRLLVIKSKTDE